MSETRSTRRPPALPSVLAVAPSPVVEEQDANGDVVHV
jgi:hypothetical protein